MSLKKVIKYIFVILGIGIFLFVSYFAYGLYTYIYWFGLEDRITYNYEPVRDGIVSYQERHDSLPLDIKFFMPEYIDKLPNLREVGSLEYNVIDTNDWELAVIAEAKGMKRELIYRTTQQLTAEEEKRLWTRCHRWFVLWVER